MKLSNDVSSVWRVENLPEFTEMFISWNGKRPEKIDIFARVYINEWSEKLLYASWGKGIQKSYDTKIDSVRTYQDAVEVLDGKKATGFEIEVSSPIRVHVFINRKGKPQEENYKFIDLPLEGISQMPLEQGPRLCSPTSTTAVVRYLSQKEVNPGPFAEAVRDQNFDIFGNWVLNVAEASSHLGKEWDTWVARLSDFSDIYKNLQAGAPVIVSIKGPLKGGALPYANGHLMVVKGYDPEKKEVLCMDPAFPSDKETLARYQIDDFVEAWTRRGKVAYLFEKRNIPC